MQGSGTLHTLFVSCIPWLVAGLVDVGAHCDGCAGIASI